MDRTRSELDKFWKEERCKIDIFQDHTGKRELPITNQER